MISKQHALPILALLATACSSGDDPAPPTNNADLLFAEGIAALETQTVAGVDLAESKFNEALLADPAHQQSRFVLALTRVGQLGTDLSPTSELGPLLTRFGIDLTNWDVFQGNDTGMGPPSTDDLPSDSPTGSEVQLLVSGEVADRFRTSADILNGVQPGFSFEFAIDGQMVEIDYVDARLLETQFRALSAQLEFQSIFDLDFDIDDAVNWESSVTMQPYTIYNGAAPLAPLQGQLCGGREGLMNEEATTGAVGFLRARLDSDSRLDLARLDLLASAQALRDVATFSDTVESPNELLFIDADQQAVFDEGLPWLDDVIAALDGSDSNVAEVLTSEGTLDGFVLNPINAWDGATYDGRWMVPDTSAQGDICLFDDTSFPHALSNPGLTALYFELTGEMLVGSDLVEFWTDLNGTWDQAFGL